MPRGPRCPGCRIPGQAAPGPRIPVLPPEQEGGSHSPGLWKLGSAPHPPHHCRASMPPCPTDSTQLGAAAAERRRGEEAVRSSGLEL